MSEKSSGIRDPLYGFIELPENLIPFIDHKLFQRLRWINQLPLEQLVYPSANHSRFEHSLGVMHLAGYVFDSLLKNSDKKNDFKKLINLTFDTFSIDNKIKLKEKIEIVKNAFQLSALYHDIGHAPFSHTFEDACKYSSEYNYDHENFGVKIVQVIFNDINELDKKYNVITNIAQEILDKSKKNIGLLQIFRNLLDGDFDIDKGDYLLRDSYHCGVNYGIYDWQRLWNYTKYFERNNSKFVFLEGAISEAWRLRLARFFMYQNVYKHRYRNKTDALLIKIISTYFNSENNEVKYSFLTNSGRLSDNNILDFLRWNDQSFISELYSKVDLKAEIEIFLKRAIKFDSYRIDINKELSIYINENNKLDDKIFTDLIKLNEKFFDSKLYFLVYKHQLNPVFEKSTLKNDIIYLDKEKKFSTIAQFYEFDFYSSDEYDDEELYSYRFPTQEKYLLVVYADKPFKLDIEKFVQELL